MKQRYSYKDFAIQANAQQSAIFINGNTPILIYPCPLTEETYNAIMSLETSSQIIHYKLTC